MTLEAYPTLPQPVYGTSAPSNPVEGQEWILPIGSPATVAWRFRYNAAISDGSPWVYIGGAPVYSYAGGFGMPGTYLANTAYDDASAPSLTCPRSGVYLLMHAGVVYPTAGPSGIIQTYQQVWRYPNGATPAVAVAADARAEFVSTDAWVMVPTLRKIVVALAANDVLKLRYATTIANAAITWDDRWLEIVPVRVG